MVQDKLWQKTNLICTNISGQVSVQSASLGIELRNVRRPLVNHGYNTIFIRFALNEDTLLNLEY